MRKIMVEPSILENSANKITQEVQDYEKSFMQLFEEVDVLKSAWEGKDNVAFTNQIRGYEDDFRQIALLCNQYSEFLKSSARAYRETQEELASQAMRLMN